MIAIKDLKDQKALKCQKTSFVTYATQMVLLDEEKKLITVKVRKIQKKV